MHLQKIFETVKDTYRLEGLVIQERTIVAEYFSSSYAALLVHYFLEKLYQPGFENTVYRMDHFTGFFSIYSISRQCNLIFGPFLGTAVTNIAQTNYLGQFQIPIRDQAAFQEFLSNLPAFPLTDFSTVFCELYYTVNSVSFHKNQVKFYHSNEISVADTKALYQGYADELLFKKDYQNSDSLYQLLKQTSHYIREGMPEQLIQSWKTPFLRIYEGLSDDVLTNYRNNALSAFAYAALSSIEGGLSPKEAFQLLDIYNFLLEHEQNVDHILSITANAMLDFATRVKECKLPQSVPPVIQAIISFIHANIYTNLRVADIAHSFRLNENYLSKLFRKHIGCSLSSYITAQKIEEAKELLKNSDHSLAVISDMLCFSSQSYFQKVFKKITGISPNKYRMY